jgi:hypothetical protein
MADDLETTILDNAQGPAKATGDSGSMEQHPLPDQIASDRYPNFASYRRKSLRSKERFPKVFTTHHPLEGVQGG